MRSALSLSRPQPLPAQHRGASSRQQEQACTKPSRLVSLRTNYLRHRSPWAPPLRSPQEGASGGDRDQIPETEIETPSSPTQHNPASSLKERLQESHQGSSAAIATQDVSDQAWSEACWAAGLVAGLAAGLELGLAQAQQQHEQEQGEEQEQERAIAQTLKGIQFLCLKSDSSTSINDYLDVLSMVRVTQLILLALRWSAV